MLRKTNIKAIDKLLDGGIPVNGLTMIASKAGQGKTLVLLTMAVKSKKDVVFYSPTLSGGELKMRITRICEALEIDSSTIHYDMNGTMWMTVRFPDHVVYVAGAFTRAMSSTKDFLASAGALADAGAVKMVLVDSPCRVGSRKDEVRGKHDNAELTRELAGIAERTLTPVVSVLLIPHDVPHDKYAQWVDSHVHDSAQAVLIVSGWPKVHGKYAHLGLAVIERDDKGNVGLKSDIMKIRHSFMLGTPIPVR